MEINWQTVLSVIRWCLRPPTKTSNLLILAASIIWLAIIILKVTSITADAFITFRVVDNFVHGYGLTWNVHERVQVYTHPLWMFLHIPFYAYWGNILYVTISLSIVCTVAAVIVTILTFRQPWPGTLALFMAPLAVSWGFTNNSIMGLENPLTHCLFACFGWVLLRAGEKRFWFWIAFTCALSLVNRLDTVFVYIPILCYLVVARFRSIRFWQCFLGASPIIGWELFSLFYYGFLFPNTKYAKLPSSFFNREYITQGLHYLTSIVVFDILSAIFMFIAVIIMPLCYIFSRRARQYIRPEMFYLALGILWYDLYVISTGGTYLYARFLSLQIFASVWLVYGLYGGLLGSPARNLKIKFSYILLAVALMEFRPMFHPGNVLLRIFPNCLQGGITFGWNAVSFSGHHLTRPDGSPPPVAHHDPGFWVTSFTGVGMGGFEMGPSAHIVNPFAITDPLLARLPNTGVPISQSYIFNTFRETPAGYLDALRTYSLAGMDPDLALYEAKLRYITSGDLWSMDRLAAIFEFNMGDEDYLLQNYLRSRWWYH